MVDRRNWLDLKKLNMQELFYVLRFTNLVSFQLIYTSTNYKP